MNQSPFLVTVEVFSDGENHSYTMLLYADTFAEAAAKAEEEWGDELMAMKIEAFEYGYVVVDSKNDECLRQACKGDLL